ncbi:hypothetical protein SARC_00809, partial [Sphaeroforma arctica JP610]
MLLSGILRNCKRAGLPSHPSRIAPTYTRDPSFLDHISTFKLVTTRIPARFISQSISSSMNDAESKPEAIVPTNTMNNDSITDTPTPPEGFTVIVEGKANGLFPADSSVFYNPVQEFNRDLSIATIRMFEETLYAEQKAELLKKIARVEAKNIKWRDPTEPARGIRILEGLSATGLRSMRFAKEIPNVKTIVANDFSAEAVKTIAKNCEFNGIPEGLVQPNHDDCAMVCYKNRNSKDQFHVIDLDPYGSPTTFLDGAIQAVAEGGLLCVTATDMAVLAGNHSEAGYAKYGSMPIKAPYCHEMALRILLQCINTQAARYKRYIVPMVSLSIDFYLRVFVRVYTSPLEVKKSASKGSLVYHCQGCNSFYLQQVGKYHMSEKGPKFAAGTGPIIDRRCENCGFSFKTGGPAWNGAIHNKAFVNKIIDHAKANKSNYGTFDRILGMLTVAQEEIETPFYYDVGECASACRSSGFKREKIWSAILNGGFGVSSTHCKDTGFKTDAPPEFIWAIYRKWATLPESGSESQQIKEGSPAFKLRQMPTSLTRLQLEQVIKEATSEGKNRDDIMIEFDEPKEFYDISFKRHEGAFPPSIGLKLKRFPMNPTANWGPKPRAKKSQGGRETTKQAKLGDGEEK